MTRLWLVRAGKHGEREQAVLEQGVLQPGFDWVGSLAGCSTREAIAKELAAVWPDAGVNTIRNFAAQLNQFVNTMQVDDLVVLPRKLAPQVAIGRIAGPYRHDARSGPVRPVAWQRTDVPRQVFGKDLLHSFGAFLTICEISRHEAVARIEAILERGTDPGPSALVGRPASATAGEETVDAEEAPFDLDTHARDQIRSLIATRFVGHEFTRLIRALLEAEGYTTNSAPPGPDGGIDIVAGRGPLGFDPPRLVIQCKSGDQVCDAPTMRELLGNISDLKADHGLLVSWGGFKTSVDKQTNQQFFKIRLWDSDDVLQALFKNYERLPEELRKLLPLKRIWTLVPDEEPA